MPLVDNTVGFGRSNLRTATIASGGTGSNAIDFGRGHAVYVVKIEDCAGFTDAATLRALVGFEEGVALADLYEANDPATIWSKDTPTSGTCAFVLTHAFGAQFLQFVASAAASQAISIKVWGFDPVVATV